MMSQHLVTPKSAFSLGYEETLKYDPRNRARPEPLFALIATSGSTCMGRRTFSRADVKPLGHNRDKISLGKIVINDYHKPSCP